MFAFGSTLAACLTVIVFGAALVGLSGAIYCQPCNPLTCPHDLHCPGGSTTDPCGCCRVCARLINETCGGSFELLGRCAAGLQCFITPPAYGAEVTGQEEGTCQEVHDITCEDVVCYSPVTMECPSDSVTLSTRRNDSLHSDCCRSTITCHCNPQNCERPACALRYEPILVTEGTGQPGSCCDQYKCQISDKCSSVICPFDTEETCPDDSYKVPSLISKDGCCHIHQGCKCHEDKCLPVECPDGLQIQVVSKATNMPDFCCEQFQCINDTGLSCLFYKEEMHDGESWKLDKCTVCTCKGGLTFCKTETCKNPLCGWMVAPEGECCPVCKGCVSESGQLYNNSDVWRENSCMTCRCDAGQLLCQAETCAVRCHNPRQVPGLCCPVCEDVDIIKQPLHCSDITNCTLQCFAGYQRDANDCYMCLCKPGDCSLHCRYGYMMDAYGVESCECAKPPHRCPKMETCQKHCMYGYKRGRHGCLKCRCNKCPPFNCTKRCLYGYILNEQDCRICKCLESSIALTTPPTDVSIVEPSAGRSCMSVEGHRHENGEKWHDGCRHCYCHNGKEMSSLITCKVPPCSDPIFRIGDCCPSCPGTAILPPGASDGESCHGSTGNHYVEGEMWNIDDCTQCICHDGNILCEGQTCSPLLCHYPVKQHNSCCARCPGDNNSTLIPKPLTRPCNTVTGDVRNHGDVWRSSACQSCTCQFGQIHCFSQMCPMVNCEKTLLRKGQCCPSCLDSQHPTACIVGGVAFSSGESWMTDDNCTECICVDGTDTCVSVQCPVLRCPVMTRHPGACCLRCHNASATTTQNAVVQQTEVSSSMPVFTVPQSDGGRDNLSEGMPEDMAGQNNMQIALIVTGVIAGLLIMLIVMLAILWYRSRRRGSLKVPQDNSLSEVKRRPKSTNLEFQGQIPYFVNLEKISLEKQLLATENGKVHSPEVRPLLYRSLTKDHEHLDDSFKSNKTFDQV